MQANTLPSNCPKFSETSGFYGQNAPVAVSIRPSFYTEKLAWSCRQEWRLEKATRIPIRLRLGSKEQVDWLEGKGR